MSQPLFVTEIKNRLVAAGIASSKILWGPRAMLPANGGYVQASETGGTAPAYLMNSKDPQILNPSLQLVAADEDYDAAMTLARIAYNSLGSVRGEYLGSTYYFWVRPIQEPFPLGVDENNRPRIAFNVNISKRA